MSDTLPDPVSATREALDLKTLGRHARRAQLSGNVLMAVGLSLAVSSAVLLLWAGLAADWLRVVLLLLAAALIPLRLLVNRLSGLTLSDGIGRATNSMARRWLGHWEAAALMVAAGLNIFDQHHDTGPLYGLAAGGLLLLARLRHRASENMRLYPTLMLAFTCVVSTFEPLWGWRGQVMMIGLSAICVVLIWQAVRLAVVAPAPADDPPQT
jgi:hypothetical protein